MFFDAVKCFPFFVSFLEPEKSLMKSKVALFMNAVYNHSLLVDPRSTHTSGTFFREDLVMKIFLSHSFSSSDSNRAVAS